MSGSSSHASTSPAPTRGSTPATPVHLSLYEVQPDLWVIFFTCGVGEVFLFAHHGAAADALTRASLVADRVPACLLPYEAASDWQPTG